MNGNEEKKIQIRDLKVTFSTSDKVEIHALDRVTLDIHEGEFVSLIGPSGCGKSTILNAVCNLVPYEGEILVNGSREPPNSLGYMFQEDTLLPWRTAIRNATVGLEIRGVPVQQAKEKVLPFMHKMGLAGFENRFPYELSGGMKKRVNLVQVIAFDPDILLMDEPFGALDAQTRFVIESDFLHLVEELKKTVAFVTHDIVEAIELSDWVVVISGRPGKIKAKYQVPLARPRQLITERSSSEFVRLQEQIWHDLKDEVQKSQKR